MNKFLIIVVLFLLVFSSFVFAHPSADIIFNYDSKAKIISVGIAHSVENLQKHFVKQIIIKVNGKNWISQNFLSQVNPNAQAASYAVVDLRKGDIVQITAICNEAGELTKTFKID